MCSYLFSSRSTRTLGVTPGHPNHLQDHGGAVNASGPGPRGRGSGIPNQHSRSVCPVRRGLPRGPPERREEHVHCRRLRVGGRVQARHVQGYLRVSLHQRAQGGDDVRLRPRLRGAGLRHRRRFRRYATYLADPDAGSSRTRERKALALRFLGHFVADMHQPLHVGFIEDLGGNLIDVSFFGGSTTNLHTVWDSRISSRAGLSSTGDGVELNNEITPAEATAWETFDLKAWAAESYELARTVAYVDENGIFLKDGRMLEDAYFNRASPVVRQRLKQAGVRLRS